jgi:RecQ-mediated genome instability protein 1
LNDCYAWLTTEGGHDPNVNLQGILDAVDHQILESDFSDSMLPGTGLPSHAAVPTTTAELKGYNVLVEVIAITEIANSAFNLNQTRMVREERMKAGDADDEEGEGDIEVEGEGPMPKYPRGMLKFQLYDGTTTLPAIEYRPLPELSLENTSLGYKVITMQCSAMRVWADKIHVFSIDALERCDNSPRDGISRTQNCNLKGPQDRRPRGATTKRLC